VLVGLGIRDIVLIERLDLPLAAGLNVLTGETGAGKSILLDALGLALGRRAEAGNVRQGAAQGSVTAEFDLPAKHPAFDVLDELGVERGESLILRRVVGADGRGRAFVNDQPVGVGALRRIGDTLVEIHGQNDEQGLLDPATHRAVLDAFGSHAALLASVRAAHGEMQAASTRLREAEAAAGRARAEEDYIRHAAGELRALDPKPAEEAELAGRRSLLQQADKIAAALQDADAAFNDNGGIASRLRVAMRALERVAERAGGKLDGALGAIDRALTEVAEASGALESATRALELDPGGLERAEERLFALRAAARKHGVPVDGLAALRDGFETRLAAIEDGGAQIKALARSAKAAEETYTEAAGKLSAARAKAATRLDRAVAKELEPLRLGAARFKTELTGLDRADWSADGADRVRFVVATNPGAPAGPIARIASGGELSRFMLALKVALAARGDAVTLVFDEVDRGVGGATAHAVGERLAALAGEVQVLVVTHSPQVAARGNAHWRIAKEVRGKGASGATTTSVAALDDSARQEEIARMLAGASVTDAARAAAASLMAGGA
jgi:DNA repair protein RecN (Recombination protein N)